MMTKEQQLQKEWLKKNKPKIIETKPDQEFTPIKLKPIPTNPKVKSRIFL